MSHALVAVFSFFKFCSPFDILQTGMNGCVKSSHQCDGEMKPSSSTEDSGHYSAC